MATCFAYVSAEVFALFSNISWILFSYNSASYNLSVQGQAGVLESGSVMKTVVPGRHLLARFLQGRGGRGCPGGSSSVSLRSELVGCVLTPFITLQILILIHGV